MHYWEMTGGIRSMDRLVELELAVPPRFSVLNRFDLATAPADRRPIPRLLLTEPEFAPDLIFSGFLFASARLRAILELAEEDIRYTPIELIKSSAAAIQADYHLFEPLKVGDPVDSVRSQGEYVDMLDSDGRPVREWQRLPGGPGGPSGLLHWREDFVPPAPVFRCDALLVTLATEEVARRVMRRSLDVAFVDVTGQGSRTELVLRAAEQSS